LETLAVFRCLSLELNQIIGKEIKKIEIHIKNEKIVNTLRQTESKLSRQLGPIEKVAN
jgi:hypothetical protein